MLASLLLAFAALTAPDPEPLSACTIIRAETLPELVRNEDARADSVELLRGFGISHLLLEAFRADVDLSDDDRALLRDYYQDNGFRVGAFFLTAQWPDFGVEDSRGIRWLNYEEPASRKAVESAVRTLARQFDELMIGEYFCTADNSLKSAESKGDRSWGEYRRALLREVAEENIAGPAREENPGIRLLFKMPQWYDRLAEFGYDPAALGEVADGISAGAESRGARTAAYGYVPAYDGYISARWVAALAGERFSGAVWFDDNDCGEHEWLQQSWNAVLSGGRELGLFKYESLLEGHADHDKYKAEIDDFRALAAHLREHPVSGIPIYMPRNSDPDGETFAAGILGMLGVPLVPVTAWPESDRTIVLSSHAAGDPDIKTRVQDWIAKGGSAVMTHRFLTRVPRSDELAALAGVHVPDRINMRVADTLITDGEKTYIRPSLRVSGDLETEFARTVLTAEALGEPQVYLTDYATEQGGRIAVLNLYTYDEFDFNRMYAPTYIPAEPALTHVNRAWADALRAAFLAAEPYTLSAPAGVTLFPLSGTGFFLQNHTDTAAEIAMTFADGAYALDGQQGTSLEFTLPAHARAWVKKAE
ncbi:MAG: hypothetical protein GC168_11565 [Candidatus Hydrogenedens sp.]|nr:hypothetical protein [Candidatus Hydrogenedens sp.]